MDVTPLKRNKALRRYLRTELFGHFSKRQRRRVMREMRNEIHQPCIPVTAAQRWAYEIAIDPNGFAGW